MSQVKTTILKLLPNLLRLLRHQVIQKVQRATFFQSWRLSLRIASLALLGYGLVTGKIHLPKNNPFQKRLQKSKRFFAF